MDSTLQILRRLTDCGVEYVLIGGMAARAHGASVHTDDVDICISANQSNFQRILAALADVRPRYRMRPDKPLMAPDHHWLGELKNLYLITDLGQLDILGELPNVATFEEARRRSIDVDFDGIHCRVLDIPTLIEAKRQPNRPKDRQAIRELEVILQRLENRS